MQYVIATPSSLDTKQQQQMVPLILTTDPRYTLPALQLLHPLHLPQMLPFLLPSGPSTTSATSTIDLSPMLDLQSLLLHSQLMQTASPPPPATDTLALLETIACSSPASSPTPTTAIADDAASLLTDLLGLPSVPSVDSDLMDLLNLHLADEDASPLPTPTLDAPTAAPPTPASQAATSPALLPTSPRLRSPAHRRSSSPLLRRSPRPSPYPTRAASTDAVFHAANVPPPPPVLPPRTYGFVNVVFDAAPAPDADDPVPPFREVPDAATREAEERAKGSEFEVRRPLRRGIPRPEPTRIRFTVFPRMTRRMETAAMAMGAMGARK
ncbi:hypothetical protein HDU96_002473 [Phlyctochytrium bullatum]|nr:hypothetical protein HDU96_002473 [Phlyctochytrium bullatum]